MTDPTQHRYIPNAEEDVKEMLAVIGVDSVDRLFDSIPSNVKLDQLLDIPGPWSEIEARRWFRELAGRESGLPERTTIRAAVVDERGRILLLRYGDE